MASGLLLLRLVVGGIMAAHGAQKVFGCLTVGRRRPRVAEMPA